MCVFLFCVFLFCVSVNLYVYVCVWVGLWMCVSVLSVCFRVCMWLFEPQTIISESARSSSSLFLCFCLCVSVCVCLWMCMFMFMHLSVSVFLCKCMCVNVCVSVNVSVSMNEYVCALSVSVFLCFCVSVFLCNYTLTCLDPALGNDSRIVRPLLRGLVVPFFENWNKESWLVIERQNTF
jgi:hypothetical protein